jgi:hypothetical protein
VRDVFGEGELDVQRVQEQPGEPGLERRPRLLGHVLDPAGMAHVDEGATPVRVAFGALPRRWGSLVLR